MLVVRLLAIATAAGIVASLLVWLFTSNVRYLNWAVRLGKFALLTVLLLLLLLVAERFIVL